VKGKKLTTFLFYLMLAAVPAAILFSPKADFSPAENRQLAAFPTPSFTALSDGSFMAATEDYIRDHFPLREQLFGLRTQLELLSGQREVNGVFVLSDRLVEKMDTVSEAAIDQGTRAVTAFSQRFSGAVSLMLIPTAASIHSDLLPPSAPGVPQKALIDRIYESLPERVGTIDCYSALAASPGLGLYYRSDPRWTSLGAYLGYNACSKQMSFTPVSSDRLNVEHASHQFRGQLYNRTLCARPLPDTIDIYSLPGSDAKVTLKIYDYEAGWSQHEGLYFREFLDSSDPYAVFLGPERPVVTVTTSVKNGRNLIVFRDSNANALTPFLAMHYSTITLVDLSMIQGPFEQLVSLEDYDQALFCYSLKTFTQENGLSKANLKMEEEKGDKAGG